VFFLTIVGAAAPNGARRIALDTVTPAGGAEKNR